MSENWLRIQFRVDASFFDELADVLEACLALSVSIENDGEDEFFEVAFPQRPTWEKIRVSALFFDTVDPNAIIDFVQTTLFADQPVPVVVEKMEEKDWVRVWLDQFKPIEVANNLWIVPSWINPPVPSANNIRLDPGLAFGTGTHATTFLCLEYIAHQKFSGDQVLDFGAGSGILAIATLLQGADQAIAVDIDPLAVESCVDNAEKNHVSDKLMALNTSEFLSSQYSQQKCNLVIANILAEVLIEYADRLVSFLDHGATLILSGVLRDQESKVRDAFEKKALFHFKTQEKNGWLLIILEKKA